VTERELLLAVADLRDAIATSAPYTGQLATVLALGQGRPAVEAALAH
jgi:hypothetical protein